MKVVKLLLIIIIIIIIIITNVIIIIIIIIIIISVRNPYQLMYMYKYQPWIARSHWG